MKIPIEDVKGKEFGFIIMTDEAWDILKTTGVNMVFELDATKDRVVAALV